jgi:hypothetical protein
MPPLPCELDAASVVLVGSLNPSIFQPAWFAAKELIRPEEGEKATVEIISQEVTSFHIPWARIFVSKERFTVAATGVDGFEAIRDLAVGTFTLLEHTPITRLGLNRHMHFRASSTAAVHAVGDRLAPKGPWKSVEAPGMLSLRMRCRRPDHGGGTLNVKVEPSVAVPNGIYVDVNDDYDCAGKSLADILQTIKDEFEVSMSFAKTLGEELSVP